MDDQSTTNPRRPTQLPAEVDDLRLQLHQQRLEFEAKTKEQQDQLNKAQIREMALNNQIEKRQLEFDRIQMEKEIEFKACFQQQQIELQKTEMKLEKNDIQLKFTQQQLQQLFRQLKLLKVIIGHVIEKNKDNIKKNRRLKTIVKQSSLLSQQAKSIKSQIQSLKPALSLSEDEQRSLQQQYKLSRLKLQQYCQQFIGHPPQKDNPMIKQFKSVEDEWELNDENNINRIDPVSGKTILHIYCEFLNSVPIEVFRYLIETCSADINRQDGKMNTPIHLAFHNFIQESDQSVNILTYLLYRRDIDVNIKDQYGCTALHHVCREINIFSIDTIKYLVEIKGADINSRDGSHNTPLYYAMSCLDPNNGGDVNILTYLLNREGIDTNSKCYSGDTLLHQACININSLPLGIFKRLIEANGCGVNVENDNHATPLHFALLSFHGDINTLQYLLNHDQSGINTHLEDQSGGTLLHSACSNISSLPIDVFKYLIETKGFDINAPNKYGNTPIHLAFTFFNPEQGGDTSTLMYLLNQEGIDVNTKGFIGRSLLHQVGFNLNKLPLDIIKYLIETKGVNVNDCDNDDETPLHLSVINLPSKLDSNVAVKVEYLIQKGVSINHKNSAKLTVLDIFSPYIPTHPLMYGVLLNNGAKLGKDC
jgi:ankyrin repeat protein